MDLEELMIFDWVETPKGNGKVLSIDPFKNIVVVSNKDGKTHMKYKPDEIKPILLSEENILKNEWYEIEHTHEDYRYYPGVVKTYKLKGYNHMLALNYRENIHSYSIFDDIVRVNYVHHLQHAIKLTNIDKEIVL